MVYVYLWRDFRLNRTGFVTASRVNVAFLFEVTLPQFLKKPLKAFSTLPEFISLCCHFSIF